MINWIKSVIIVSGIVSAIGLLVLSVIHYPETTGKALVITILSTIVLGFLTSLVVEIKNELDKK